MEALKASSRTVEITVLSAEDLIVDRKRVTKNAYVVVRAESINSYTTSMAREGGSYPSWNEKFDSDIPLHARSVTFEVHCKMPTGAVRSVGVARLALSDFLAEGTLPENLQFLSCRLRNGDGTTNGVINFSVKASPYGFLKFLGYRLRDRQGRRNGIINFSVRVQTPPECLSLMAKPVEGVAAAAVNETSVHGFQMPIPLVDQQSSNGAVAGVPFFF